MSPVKLGIIMTTHFTRGEREGKWLSCEQRCDCSLLTASGCQVIGWDGKSCSSCQEKPLASQEVLKGYLSGVPDVTVGKIDTRAP